MIKSHQKNNLINKNLFKIYIDIHFCFQALYKNKLVLEDQFNFNCCI